MELLLKNRSQLDSKENGGRRPLTWAIESGNVEVIQLLLDRGAKVEYWYWVVSEFSLGRV